MESPILILILLLVFIYFHFSFKVIKKYRKKRKFIILEVVFASLYILSLFIFQLGFVFNSAPYNIAIDPIDSGYCPFGEDHMLTLIVFYILFFFSAILLWIKGRKLPPLTLVLSLVFLIIGSVICSIIILQVMGGISSPNKEHSVNELFALTPLLSIVISIVLLLKIIYEEANISINRQYKNKILNKFNTLLSKSQRQPLWVIGLLLPVFIIITLILTLVGQDTNSMMKVFTDTTTWTFSQQTHPPYLDHQGHYLCTVAVCGNPKVVKPLRLGDRHGNQIIVNRQLLIANAYEEMIQDYTPKFHRYIRFIYDKYGYPFSKHINTPMKSNIIYFLMKPLEWLFLLNLYLFCIDPETKINQQYKT